MPALNPLLLPLPRSPQTCDSGDHERVLLESNFVPALNKLLEGATTAIRGRATYPAALDAPLKALLDVLADVANLSSGKPQRESGEGAEEAEEAPVWVGAHAAASNIPISLLLCTPPCPLAFSPLVTPQPTPPPRLPTKQPAAARCRGGGRCTALQSSSAWSPS